MTRPNILIVFHSRTGTTRTIALHLAERLGCDVEELIDRKNRSGTRGWFLSAFDAIFERHTTLMPVKHDPGAYDLVLIGTPIWALNVSTPVRTYLDEHHVRLRDVAFFLTHGGIARARVFKRMSQLARRAPRAELGLNARELDRGEHLGKLREFVDRLTALLAADDPGSPRATETNATLAESALIQQRTQPDSNPRPSA